MSINQPIQLYVEQRQTPADDTPASFAWLQGADALVLDPDRCTPRQFESMPVERAILLNGDPERDHPWGEIPGQWVCDRGIETTARLRDLHPQLHWIPRLSVSRAQVSYRFSGPAVGEGFSFYMPDTTAIKGWQVAGISLEAVLDRVTALGFDDLWLHSPKAASRGKGLDLDLLEKTERGDLAVWLSGGVGDAGHLRNLARVGGASAVIVDAAVAQACSLATLSEALVAEPPRPEAVPMTFTPRKVDQEAP
ncbi:MAG: HisA/HisF-related TIM barrel protein [Candidatus Thiodiazotropha sp.]